MGKNGLNVCLFVWFVSWWSPWPPVEPPPTRPSCGSWKRRSWRGWRSSVPERLGQSTRSVCLYWSQSAGQMLAMCVSLCCNFYVSSSISFWFRLVFSTKANWRASGNETTFFWLIPDCVPTNTADFLTSCQKHGHKHGGWKCPDNSPKVSCFVVTNWLEMSWYLVRKCQFCCYKCSLKRPKVCSKICGFDWKFLTFRSTSLSENTQFYRQSMTGNVAASCQNCPILLRQTWLEVSWRPAVSRSGRILQKCHCGVYDMHKFVRICSLQRCELTAFYPGSWAVPVRRVLVCVQKSHSPTHYTWSISESAKRRRRHSSTEVLSTGAALSARPAAPLDNLNNKHKHFPFVAAPPDRHEPGAAQGPGTETTVRLPTSLPLAKLFTPPRNTANSLNKYCTLFYRL